jgi:hypothetical protein
VAILVSNPTALIQLMVTREGAVRKMRNGKLTGVCKGHDIFRSDIWAPPAEAQHVCEQDTIEI